jgi:hypothetical protein
MANQAKLSINAAWYSHNISDNKVAGLQPTISTAAHSEQNQFPTTYPPHHTEYKSIHSKAYPTDQSSDEE